MKNTIEIQKEFEILVSELEKLKSINELTSSNANSAKTVVNEIDKFINSVELYKSTIDKDLKQKNLKIGILLKNLEEAIDSIESNTKNSVTKHSHELKKLHAKSDFIIIKNKKELSLEIAKFVDTLSNFSESISLTIENTSSKISDKIEEKNKQINIQIGKVSKLIGNHLNEIETNINNKFQELNELINQNKKQNKRNGLILIVSSIVTLGLLIALIMK